MIAKVQGTMLAPGVSLNDRLYTPQLIERAVTRMQARLADGDARPIVMRSHHGAGDDTTRIVGHLTDVHLDDQGHAKYEAVLNDTQAAKDILAAAGDEKNPSLRNVSIYGWWTGKPKSVRHDGRMVETADDLEIDAVDFTAFPGVEKARIDSVTPASTGAGESTVARRLITESFDAELVVDEAATPSMSKRGSGLNGTGGPYADPGYQKDKKQRYQLDTKAHAKAAWGYINRAKNQKPYNATQLKAIKGRIRSALKKFGVTVTDESTTRPAAMLGETTLGECYPCDDDTRAGFSISAHNGPINCTVSAYSGIDPAELEVIATAAMQAACDALKALDPDMDADIDVPGAPDADTDNSMDGESTLLPATVTPKQMADQLARAKAKQTAETAPAPQTPEPTVAGPTAKESAMPDEQKAVEQAATTEAAPQRALTDADIAALAGALKDAFAPQTPAAAEPAATESTTPAPAPAAETAEPAQEATPAEQDTKAIATEAQKAVQAAIREAIPELLSEYGLPRRKGYRTTESTDAPADPQELWDKRGEVWNTVIPGGTPAAPVAPTA